MIHKLTIKYLSSQYTNSYKIYIKNITKNFKIKIIRNTL